MPRIITDKGLAKNLGQKAWLTKKGQKLAREGIITYPADCFQLYKTEKVGGTWYPAIKKGTQSQ